MCSSNGEQKSCHLILRMCLFYCLIASRFFGVKPMVSFNLIEILCLSLHFYKTIRWRFDARSMSHMHNVNKLMKTVKNKFMHFVVDGFGVVELHVYAYVYTWCMCKTLFVLFSSSRGSAKHELTSIYIKILFRFGLFCFVANKNSKCRITTKQSNRAPNLFYASIIAQRFRWAIECLFAVSFYSICLYCSSCIQVTNHTLNLLLLPLLSLWCCCSCRWCCCCCCCCYCCGLANTHTHTLDKTMKQRQQIDK